MEEIFNQPLQMQSSTFETLVLNLDLNEALQDNFCHLIDSQQATLKLLNAEISINTRTTKMSHLVERRLDMPLETIYITVTDDDPVITFHEYTVKELQELIMGQPNPNLTTTELKFKNKVDNRIQEFIPHLVSKFPNLTSIEFVEGDYQAGSIASFNGLQQLKHFMLEGSTCVLLRDLNISKLETFSFYILLTENFKNRDLLEFLDRHRDLRELKLDISTFRLRYYHEPYAAILIFTLKKLKKLMKVTVGESSVRKHANPGFILKREHLDEDIEYDTDVFMKRQDNQIIILNNKEGMSWQKYDPKH